MKSEIDCKNRHLAFEPMSISSQKVIFSGRKDVYVCK